MRGSIKHIQTCPEIVIERFLFSNLCNFQKTSIRNYENLAALFWIFSFCDLGYKNFELFPEVHNWWKLKSIMHTVISREYLEFLPERALCSHPYCFKDPPICAGSCTVLDNVQIVRPTALLHINSVRIAETIHFSHK